MTANEYQRKALRTEGTVTSDSVKYTRLIEGLMGLSGEAGEAIDSLKKVLYQGHEFDRLQIARELGDVAWYLALSADAIGYDLETILQMNIDKLLERYPNGFDPKMSIHRKNSDI